MAILKKFILKNSLLLLAVLSSIIFSLPLFHKGLLPTHDGEYHVVRSFEFDKTFRDGNIYPRWTPDLNKGFGIPLFNYVYPFPNYTALLFHFLGFSFIDSFKANLFLATIVGSIFSYLFAKEFWGKLGGLVTSVLYTFSPYHALDVYIRGSVGEAWAIALLPGFLWLITKFLQNYSYKYFVFSSLLLGFIIFSHNILALMFFLFCGAYSIFIFLRSKSKTFQIALMLLGIFVFSAGITSIFWIPAILERNFVRGLEVYDYSRNFPDLYQLLIPSWGSGFSSGALQNQLSFQIGIANLTAILLSIFLVFRKFKYKNILIFFLVCFTIVFLLVIKISMPVWQILPFMNYFQFPWRFLSLEILFTSFLAGSVIFLPKPKIFASLLIILSVILGVGYTRVAYYLERPDSYYTTRPNFIDGTNSPGNAFNTIWFDSTKTKESNKIYLEDSEVKKKEIKSTRYSLQAEINSTRRVTVNTAYFPGWNVYIDNRKKETSITKSGLFSFEIEKGAHNVVIKFEDTTIRKFAAAISIFSILSLLFARSFFATIKR